MLDTDRGPLSCRELAGLLGSAAEQRLPERKPGEQALLLHASGTTARPKLVR